MMVRSWTRGGISLRCCLLLLGKTQASQGVQGRVKARNGGLAVAAAAPSRKRSSHSFNAVMCDTCNERLTATPPPLTPLSNSGQTPHPRRERVLQHVLQSALNLAPWSILLSDIRIVRTVYVRSTLDTFLFVLRMFQPSGRLLWRVCDLRVMPTFSGACLEHSFSPS